MDSAAIELCDSRMGATKSEGGESLDLFRVPKGSCAFGALLFAQMAAQSESITQLLADASKGKRASLDALFPLVYGELRRLADAYLRGERSDHTLQATALVHEAYLRLVDQTSITWKSRAQFFSVAAQVMRHILVDYARAHQTQKRSPGHKVSLDQAINVFAERDLSLIALDDALKALAQLDERQSRIVELRFFGGLTINEVAEVLQVSPQTISLDWSLAKIWLHRELSRE